MPPGRPAECGWRHLHRLRSSPSAQSCAEHRGGVVVVVVLTLLVVGERSVHSHIVAFLSVLLVEQELGVERDLEE